MERQSMTPLAKFEPEDEIKRSLDRRNTATAHHCHEPAFVKFCEKSDSDGYNKAWSNTTFSHGATIDPTSRQNGESREADNSMRRTMLSKRKSVPGLEMPFQNKKRKISQADIQWPLMEQRRRYTEPAIPRKKSWDRASAASGTLQAQHGEVRGDNTFSRIALIPTSGARYRRRFLKNETVPESADDNQTISAGVSDETARSGNEEGLLCSDDGSLALSFEDVESSGDAESQDDRNSEDDDDRGFEEELYDDFQSQNSQSICSDHAYEEAEHGSLCGCKAYRNAREVPRIAHKDAQQHGRERSNQPYEDPQPPLPIVKGHYADRITHLSYKARKFTHNGEINQLAGLCMAKGGWTGEMDAEKYMEMERWANKVEQSGPEGKLAWLKEIAAAPAARQQWTKDIQAYLKERRKRNVRKNDSQTHALPRPKGGDIQDFREVVETAIRRETRVPDLLESFDERFRPGWKEFGIDESIHCKPSHEPPPVLDMRPSLREELRNKLKRLADDSKSLGPAHIVFQVEAVQEAITMGQRLIDHIWLIRMFKLPIKHPDRAISHELSIRLNAPKTGRTLLRGERGGQLIRSSTTNSKRGISIPATKGTRPLPRRVLGTAPRTMERSLNEILHSSEEQNIFQIPEYQDPSRTPERKEKKWLEIMNRKLRRYERTTRIISLGISATRACELCMKAGIRCNIDPENPIGCCARCLFQGAPKAACNWWYDPQYGTLPVISEFSVRRDSGHRHIRCTSPPNCPKITPNAKHADHERPGMVQKQEQLKNIPFMECISAPAPELCRPSTRSSSSQQQPMRLARTSLATIPCRYCLDNRINCHVEPMTPTRPCTICGLKGQTDCSWEFLMDDCASRHGTLDILQIKAAQKVAQVSGERIKASHRKKRTRRFEREARMIQGGLQATKRCDHCIKSKAHCYIVTTDKGGWKKMCAQCVRRDSTGCNWTLIIRSGSGVFKTFSCETPSDPKLAYPCKFADCSKTSDGWMLRHFFSHYIFDSATLGESASTSLLLSGDKNEPLQTTLFLDASQNRHFNPATFAATTKFKGHRRSKPTAPQVTRPAAADDNTLPSKARGVQRATEQRPPVVRVHQCVTCNRIFSSNYGLKRHMLIHSNQWLTCTFEGCTRRFRHRDNLKFHMKSHAPPEEKPHGCDFPGCTRRFDSTTAKLRHMKAYDHQKARRSEMPHKTFLDANGKKRFACVLPSCKRDYSQKWFLSRHMKNHHKLDTHSVRTRSITDRPLLPSNAVAASQAHTTSKGSGKQPVEGSF